MPSNAQVRLSAVVLLALGLAVPVARTLRVLADRARPPASAGARAAGALAGTTAAIRDEARSAGPVGTAASLLFGGRLNVNRASPGDLEALPGIGPKRAMAIVEARRRRGGRFDGLADLRDIPGLGARTLAQIDPLVTFGSGP